MSELHYTLSVDFECRGVEHAKQLLTELVTGYGSVGRVNLSGYAAIPPLVPARPPAQGLNEAVVEGATPEPTRPDVTALSTRAREVAKEKGIAYVQGLLAQVGARRLVDLADLDDASLRKLKSLL